MDARPAVMRQRRDHKAISQSAPQYARKQGGDCNPHRTNARERRSERMERTGRAASSSEEPEATRRPDRRSQTPEREPRPTTGENTQERTGKKSNHVENWKTQPPREPQKFPRGTAPLDPTVNRHIQRRKKSQLPGRDSAEATALNRNGVNETHPLRGEETITKR